MTEIQIGSFASVESAAEIFSNKPNFCIYPMVSYLNLQCFVNVLFPLSVAVDTGSLVD